MIYHVRTIHALNRKISGSAHAHSVVQRFVRFMMFLVIWEANFCQCIPTIVSEKPMLLKLPSKSVRLLLPEDCLVSRRVMRVNTTRCWSHCRLATRPRRTTEIVSPESFVGNVARLRHKSSNLQSCGVRIVQREDQNEKHLSIVCVLAWTNHRSLTSSRRERALCLTSLTLVSLILLALKRHVVEALVWPTDYSVKFACVKCKRCVAREDRLRGSCSNQITWNQLRKGHKETLSKFACQKPGVKQRAAVRALQVLALEVHEEGEQCP